MKNNLDKPLVVTFGCRLNTYESEIIYKHALKQKLRNTIIFNTCAVTNEAERQVRQAIRKARKENPNATIIVSGCSAQLNPEFYSNMKEVDKVIGNIEKLKEKNFFPDIEEKQIVQDITKIKDIDDSTLISNFRSKTRALLQIQNGCDNKCTYCVIPYVRGPSRSVPASVIINQVQKLVDNGYKELIITGVNISAYGKDLSEEITFSNIIDLILNKFPQIARLRLSSLDISKLDKRFFELFEKENRIMPHLHISLQSGDDIILKRMNRTYNRQEVMDFCAQMRKIRPDVVFGADVIVGFPTETEDMFYNTCDLIEKCNITYLHTFPYSRKEKTPAAYYKHQLEKNIIKQRALILRNKSKEILLKFLQLQVNKKLKVLIENENTGKSEQFIPVRIFSEKTIPSNTVKNVLVVDVFKNGLLAKDI